MAPRASTRFNSVATAGKQILPTTASEINCNKLTKLLVPIGSSVNSDDESGVHELSLFFKLVAVCRCCLELNRNAQRCHEARELVAGCILDFIAPGTTGKISRNLAAEIPLEYYFLAMSALLSCDVDLHADIPDLQQENLSVLMLMLRSPFVKLRRSQINVPFGIILNHQSRVYADDDEFYEWLSHRDNTGRNVMHYLAAALNAECLSELSNVIALRQSTFRRKKFDDEDSAENFTRCSFEFSNLLFKLANEPDENGDTPLFYAVRDGPRRARDNISFMDEMINLGASLTHLNNERQSLLMLAHKTNKAYLVRYLIYKCVSIPSVDLKKRCNRVVDLVMARDASNMSSFHYAVKANSLECARELALGIVLYGVGKEDKHVGTSQFLLDVNRNDNKFFKWCHEVRDEVLGKTVYGRNGGRTKFQSNWSRQHFVDFLDIFQGKFARASISHDITHEHTDARCSLQHSAIKAVNEVDDVMYPEQIKYEDRDLFPILAADAVRNIKRDKNAKLAPYCCDCKGTCVFGYCPCMNAIDYDAYNEHGRCRMLAKVRSDIYHWGGAFRYEGDNASVDLPNDPTKLGRSAAAVNRSNRRRTMTSAGNSRRANLSMNDDDDEDGGGASSNAAAKPNERRSIILPPLIVECGEMCQCARNLCRNRVTQNSTRLPRLEVFRSRKCGWGVRTLDPIKPGQIICTMSGLLTRSENVDDPMYCMSLIDLLRTGPNGERIDERDLPKDDNECDRQFNLDSKDFGNIGRFLNHSCSPNCATTAVLHDQHDLRTPKIALFAMKSIHVLAELTWFYSMNYWSGNGDYGTCKCGASNCQWRNKNKDNDAAEGNGGGGKNKGRKTGGNVRSKIRQLPPMSPSAVSDGGTILDDERYRSVSVEDPIVDPEVLRRNHIHTRRSDDVGADEVDGPRNNGGAVGNAARESEEPEGSPPDVRDTNHYLLCSIGKGLRIYDEKAKEIALDVAENLPRGPSKSKKPAAEYYKAKDYEFPLEQESKKTSQRRNIERRWFYEPIGQGELPVADGGDESLDAY